MRYVYMVWCILLSSVTLQCNDKPTFIFATELDGVVLHRDWVQISKNLSYIFTHAHNKCALTQLAFNPFFWKDCYNGLFHLIQINDIHLRHSNHLISYLISKYPSLAPYEKDLMKAFNEYKLNEEVIQLLILLKKINKQSYKIYVATNKNSPSLALTYEKVDPLLKKRFGLSWNDLFDGVFHEDMRSKSGGLYALKPKPSPEFFAGLWHYLTLEKKIPIQNSKLIFIDSHKKNIIGARTAEQTLLIPIHAILYKNLQGLEQSISNEFSA